MLRKQDNGQRGAGAVGRGQGDAVEEASIKIGRLGRYTKSGNESEREENVKTIGEHNAWDQVGGFAFVARCSPCFFHSPVLNTNEPTRIRRSGDFVIDDPL
jgi:hypothetical protein